MWLTGGFNIGNFEHYTDVWTSTDGANWELVSDQAPWGPRAMHAMVVFDGMMWVMGGGIYNHNYPLNTVADYGDVWCSDDGDRWAKVASTAWPARRFHASAVYDGKLWVLGGFARGNRNDVWCSNNGSTWSQHQAPWPIRHESGCLVHDGKLWIFGGYGDTLYNDVWALGKAT
jgi:N-acetylneuraminic acid mutarotase